MYDPYSYAGLTSLNSPNEIGGGLSRFNPVAPRSGPTQFDPNTDVANGGDTTAYAAPSARSASRQPSDQNSRLLALLQRLGINPAEYGISAYAEGGVIGSGDVTTATAPDVTGGVPGAPIIPGSTNDLNLQLQQLIGKMSAPQVAPTPPPGIDYGQAGGGGPSGDSSDSSSASAPGDAGAGEGSGGSGGNGGPSGASGDGGPSGAAGAGEGGGSYAGGGLIALAGGGKLAVGPGGGLDDLIPTSINGRRAAALSDGEFVIPADVVSMMGDGSSNAGSRRLYDLVKQVRQTKTGTHEQAGPLPVGEILKRVM